LWTGGQPHHPESRSQSSGWAADQSIKESCEMSDEEGSVFSGLSEAFDSAVDAAGELQTAAFDAYAAAGGTLVVGAESIAAGAAYAVGSYDTANELDQMRQEDAAVVREAASQAVEHAENAGEEIWGG
jgi:hypothetical protein